MNLFKNEKSFTILLIILAVAGLAGFTADYFRRISVVTDKLDTKVFAVKQKDDYKNAAKLFLEQNNIDTEGTFVSYSESPDVAEDSFLKRTIGEREGYLYRKQFDYPNTLINVRFFKELEKHEAFVSLDPNSLAVKGFVDVIPENEVRTNVERDAAQKQVEDFLSKQNIALGNLEMKDYSSQKIQDRVDHYFTYKFKGSEVNTKYGEGYIDYNIAVFGDRVGSYGVSFFIPENFNRELDKLQSIGDLLASLSWIITILMAILGLIFTIIAFKKEEINWKLFIVLFALLTLSLLVASIFDYNTILGSYTTDQYLYVYIANFLLSTIITSSLLNAIVPLAGFGGGYLEKFSKYKITSIKENLFSNVLKGYLIAFVSLGMVTLIYYIGEKYFGVWQMGVVEPYNSFFEYSLLLTTFYICLTSAFSEEIIFRYFGFVLFNRFISSAFVAMLLTVLVWALGHSTYPVFPVYFRGIELLIDGMIWGYFILRYNIATTITAHFIYNAFLTCFGLYLTLNFVYMTYATILLFIPIFCVIIAKYARRKI